MLSVIICEDEPIQTTLLVKLVQQWADQCALPVQILSYPNAESFLFSYEEQPFGDILLLDIQMAQMNGMELARKIRERNRRIQITFLTGLPDFISEGYEVDALHYLIKPIQEKKLFQVLDRAVLNLQQAPKVVLLPINGRPVRIPITDIFYAGGLFPHDSAASGRRGGIPADADVRFAGAAGRGFLPLPPVLYRIAGAYSASVPLGCISGQRPADSPGPQRV